MRVLTNKAKEAAAHVNTNVPYWFEHIAVEHEPHTEGVRRNLLTGDIETNTPLHQAGPVQPIAPHFHHMHSNPIHSTFGLNSVPLPPPRPLLVPTIRAPGAKAPDTTSKQTMLQPPQRPLLVPKNKAAGPKETTYRPAPVPPKAVRPKQSGSGRKKKVETIETKKALMPYFDIMDDPYFIKV